MLTCIIPAVFIISVAVLVRGVRQWLRDQEQRDQRASWFWAQRYYALRDESDRDLS
jgi:hypothetical protein